MEEAQQQVIVAKKKRDGNALQEVKLGFARSLALLVGFSNVGSLKVATK